jgi:hypothetical protein
MNLSCTILCKGRSPRSPSPPVVAFGGGGEVEPSDGKEGRRQGQVRVDGGGFAGFTVLSNDRPALTAGPPVDPSSSGQPADRTAARLPPVTSKNGSGMLAASLTGRTAWALFSPNPGHHASAACAWMDAQQVSGPFTPFHSWAANGRRNMAAAPVPTRPPPRHSAGLACAASVSQQPLYTQSGPVTRTRVSCRPPFAIASAIPCCPSQSHRVSAWRIP